MDQSRIQMMRSAASDKARIVVERRGAQNNQLSSVSPRPRGQSKPRLDARGEGVEVADAGDFVIGELHAKVIFEASKQFQRLQAVDVQFLEEVVIGLEVGARNLELRRGQIQDFFRSLVQSFHKFASGKLFYRKTAPASGYGR